MSAAAITRAVATAKRLISKYGADVTWTQYADGALPDADKPERPGPRVPSNKPAKVLFMRDSRQGYEFLKHLVGKDFASSDEKFLLAGDCGFTPSTADTFSDGAAVYQGFNLNPVRPDGRVVLWIGGIKR